MPRSPLLPALGLTLFLGLAGCVTIKPGSPALALASADTRTALAVLDQRTPEDITRTEKLIARLEPGKAGWVRLASGKPFIAIRSTRQRGELVNIWLTDSAGRLVNIATITEYRDGHVLLHNPTVEQWKSWEEAKAHDLYNQLAAKLAAPNAPETGPWPPAK